MRGVNNGFVLTPTTLLNKAKRMMGITHFPLPLTDEELLQTLNEDTLPTFSIYFPYRVTMPFDLTKAHKVPGNQNQYYLDPIIQQLAGCSIVEIEDIKYTEYSADQCFMPNTLGYDAYDLFASAQNQATLEAMMAIPMTFNFIPPNVLEIDEPAYGTRTTVNLILLVTHPANLSTIKISYLDFITKLYMIDLEIVLYNNLKHMDKIDTTFAQIDLKIDDWQDAASKREELLKEWDEIFLSHRTKKLYRA